MVNMAIKSKHIIIGTIIVFVLLFAIKFTYKFQYIASYCEIELNEVARVSDPFLNANEPYWVSLEDSEKVENIKKKYSVSLENIDFKKKMIVISYGAELKSMDYNIQESTFKTRGHYIGFPQFGDLKPNTIFIYETELIPIFNAEVAGFLPDYKGKYR